MRNEDNGGIVPHPVEPFPAQPYVDFIALAQESVPVITRIALALERIAAALERQQPVTYVFPQPQPFTPTYPTWNPPTYPGGTSAPPRPWGEITCLNRGDSPNGEGR